MYYTNDRWNDFEQINSQTHQLKFTFRWIIGL